ncbi:phosphatidylserine decarboxylase 1 [Thoreauomyces humboldtii]|nr:phosphatidylserine decarboxylase 1 [Thoreauomyces humboldtii]
MNYRFGTRLGMRRAVARAATRLSPFAQQHPAARLPAAAYRPTATALRNARSFHSSQFHGEQQQPKEWLHKEHPKSFPSQPPRQQEQKKTKKKTGLVWKPIPIALGLVCIALVHLIRVSRRDEEAADGSGKLVKIEGPWHVHVYAALPLRGMSRLWGWGNDLTVPVWLRGPLYRTYASMFGCNLEEMEDPILENYANLGAFFYRTLVPGARPIETKAPLVSPADGRVLHFGLITGERTVEQIKGVTYSLDALLGRHKVENTDGKNVHHPDPALTTEALALAHKTHSASVVSDTKFADINSIDYSLDRILGEDHPQVGETNLANTTARVPNAYGGHVLRPGNALFFAVIYLAPGDYHRFHSPADWIAERRRHFSGELYSVSPLAVNMIKNLFVLNERVVLMGDWEHGFFSMIPVGATNVGSIKIDFDPELRTNLGRRQLKHAPGTYDERTYPTGKQLKKGDEMGGFKLGSTVVLVFEAPSEFEFTLEAGQKVQVGEAIGRFRS